MSNHAGAKSLPCIDELPADSSGSTDSEKSNSNTSRLNNSANNSANNSPSSCPKETVQPGKEEPNVCPEPDKNQIISLSNLNLFAEKVDEAASLDEQAAELVANCANVFVKDVSMRLVKLAKYRNAIPSILDLKFTLKREYNMEFPQRRISQK